MQILCPRTWSWASTTWRWTVEKKKDSWAVSGCLKRTTCVACHSEEPRLIILLSPSILGCGPRSGQQRTTGRQKSQDRETPHWNSVCMSWGGAGQYYHMSPARRTASLNLNVINCTQLPPLLSFLSWLPSWCLNSPLYAGPTPLYAASFTVGWPRAENRLSNK